MTRWPMGSVLIVDDLPGSARLVESLLAPDLHTIRTAGDGVEALRLVRADPPDLVLMDVMMPRVDGFEACRAIKQDPATRLIPVVLVTSLDDTDSRLRGIDAGADDFVSKPFNAPELRARVRSLLRIKHYTDDLESAESVIVSLALTIEARDAHDRRPLRAAVAVRRTRWAARSGSTTTPISALVRGGFLHDVGKVGIPDAILLKPGPLTRDEYAQMKQHTIIGDRLCGGLRSLRTGAADRPASSRAARRQRLSGRPARRRGPAPRADHGHRRRLRRDDDAATVHRGPAGGVGRRRAAPRSGARLAARRSGRAVSRPGGAAGVGAGAGMSDVTPIAILAVDDEPGVLALVRRCLDDERITLTASMSGAGGARTRRRRRARSIC